MCDQCGKPLSAACGFFELTHQPVGTVWRFCTLTCLVIRTELGAEV